MLTTAHLVQHEEGVDEDGDDHQGDEGIHGDDSGVGTPKDQGPVRTMARQQCRRACYSMLGH
jgi:hypothetical protein